MTRIAPQTRIPTPNDAKIRCWRLPIIIANPVYFAPITRDRVCCGKLATVDRPGGSVRVQVMGAALSRANAAMPPATGSLARIRLADAVIIEGNDRASPPR